MEEELTISMLRNLKTTYASALDTFIRSPSSFQILKTYPPRISHSAPSPRTLYVLDSSFNPPTHAHTRIALSALWQDSRGANPKRLMFLLSTQNADKASEPASFEDRLVMMTLMASDVVARAVSSAPEQQDRLVVDIALTKKPYFHDKAAAIDDSGVFQNPPQQVHLAGFDTLIRIFDTKYYPPFYNFDPLDPFLTKHRLRITYRPDDGWGASWQQEKYVKDIREGWRESQGLKREWAGNIDIVEGKPDKEETVSSTKARNTAKAGGAELEKYVAPSIREWIVSEGLYRSP